ncbi:hypothetical protein [Streptomyces sp. L2]|uniref:hypothetical protein n=1 Tax=Streptomyces sp. L2 TaxID=2162665 RepID=UPI001010BD3C|nr:hypothetical protein [Streptomyces sp. L2]
MSTRPRLRRLVVDGTVYRWTVRHRHRVDGPACSEVLSLFRDGVPVRIALPSLDGGWGGHFGLVADDHGHAVNLHEPAVVRAFVEELGSRWPAGGEVDDPELLCAVAVRCAAEATPGVPPGCPPGP